MKLSLSVEELKSYLGKQLDNYFPDGLTEKYFRGEDVDRAIRQGLERVEYCFKHVNMEAYSNDRGETFFSHLHIDQYSAFLYYFMNTLWQNGGNEDICRKVMSLNRALSGVYVTYKTKLPDIYLTYHSAGTVLGEASYSNYFIALQNVTINTGGGGTPHLGKGLYMAAGSSIIGVESVGDWVAVGVNTTVYNQKIGDNKLVINRSGAVEVLENRLCRQKWYFRIEGE